MQTTASQIQPAESDLNPPPGIFQGSTHPAPRGSADYVMAVQRGLERDRGEEVVSKLRAQRLQLSQSECIQLAPALKSEAHSIADNLMRLAEGNALVGKVGGGGHGIEVAGLSGDFHAVEANFKEEVKPGRTLSRP